MWNLLLGSIIRHAMSGVGAVVAAEGFATGDQINAITGGAVALAAVIASLWAKFKAKK